ncbi:protein NRT1/ PTR FAMILY 4.5-like [Juglans regia]|uniref:Protein NRT1/ PTR FAMILY 4.5-like n=1 Tax=Juglans regia TaxID=51240 RepID=A0A6P9EI96_JUGRE|nr:protein NRT1/ PTR FAMILY 4.5-like [Juglans regia]
MGDAEAEAGYYPLGIGRERKGGFTASTFVFAFTALENMGFVANMVSMFLYFLQVMLFDLSTAANTLTNLMGSTFLLSLIGGFISDTYLSRLYTCLVFGVLEILALVLMTIQAYSHDLHPDPCGKSNCLEGGIALVFYLSLCMLALGSGGVRGSLPALGGDQFDQKNPKEAKDLASFFNWLLLSITIGAAVGVTVIVWVSVNVNWYWGFFISSVAALAGFVILGFGKPFYRLRAPGESPIIRIIQVIVVAIKNRKLPLPEKPDHFYEISDEGTISTEEQIAHTHQFRFLDKAAILREDSKPTPWTVCTVTQVEEVKILTRMLPIVASTIIMNTCLAQLQTFSVQQGNMMDRHLGSMEVPAPSIPVIPLVFMSILIPIYEFFFVPLARKFTHHPSGITQLQRVGVGLVLSAISMAIAGIVEIKRRNQATKLGPSTKPLSLFWLSFQYGIFGIADMFTLVGLLEFFYKEAPAGMRSLSTSLTWLSLSFGYFLSSVFVDVINAVTKRKGKKGWLHGYNLNENNLDLFYWFLAVLSCLNFLNYLYWASWYKYKAEVPDSKPKPRALYGPNLVDHDESSTLDNDQARAICGATHAKDEIPQENEAKNNEACSSDLKEAGND